VKIKWHSKFEAPRKGDVILILYESQSGHKTVHIGRWTGEDFVIHFNSGFTHTDKGMKGWMYVSELYDLDINPH
jgi:hypothetical protein